MPITSWPPVSTTQQTTTLVAATKCEEFSGEFIGDKQKYFNKKSDAKVLRYSQDWTSLTGEPQLRLQIAVFVEVAYGIWVDFGGRSNTYSRGFQQVPLNTWTRLLFYRNIRNLYFSDIQVW